MVSGSEQPPFDMAETVRIKEVLDEGSVLSTIMDPFGASGFNQSHGITFKTLNNKRFNSGRVSGGNEDGITSFAPGQSDMNKTNNLYPSPLPPLGAAKITHASFLNQVHDVIISTNM